MNLTYSKFTTKSMKARLSWVQRTLGIPVTYKRDKTTIKALQKFQKEHGITASADLNEVTFDALYENGGSEINIDERV